jgi:aryl carrier-like protein
LNDPEKTAEVFIEDPEWGEKKPGTVRRLYKTGDLAYFNSEGCIMFIGRKDTQVKVRGQRVELGKSYTPIGISWAIETNSDTAIGEIETHLSLNKQIQHAMVMYPKVGLCKRKLVGIISLKDFGATTNTNASIELVESDDLKKASDDIAEITANLSAKVPGYMVPNIWVVLRSVPLLVSGKLNRKRVEQWLNHIDEPTHHRICGIGDANKALAPRNRLETELRNIWAEVLKLPASELGTTQHFTALGGDSILAMVVISKLRKKGSNISMADMIKAGNIMKLALLIQQGTATTTFSTQPVVEETTNEVFDLTPMQQYYANFTLKQSNYLCKQTNKRFNHTFCLRVKKRLSASDLSMALEALVERHSMLRARFVRDEGAACGWRQYVPDMSSGSFHFGSWDNYTIDQITPTIEKFRLSLDLENGPIMAADLVTVDEENQYFFIVAHHLVVDLVSWNAILRDLEDMIIHGEFVADKPYPFSTWAKLQREFAEKSLTPQIAYPLKVPPADFAYWGMDRNVHIVRDAAFHQIVLSQTDTTALIQACAKLYSAEPMDILCSALWHSFSLNFRDRNTPTIFRYGHGRENGSIPGAGSPDISSTVGWFTTLSPLHVPVSSKDDSLTLLHRTVQTRKRVPANGFHYFASRYHNKSGLDPAGQFAGHDNMEITINYLGVSDGQQRNSLRIFEIPKDMEAGTSRQDKEVKVFSLFYVSAEVQDGRMHLTCMHNTRAEKQENIEAWFGAYEQCLVDLARRAAAGQIPRRRVVPARRMYGKA